MLGHKETGADRPRRDIPLPRGIVACPPTRTSNTDHARLQPLPTRACYLRHVTEGQVTDQQTTLVPASYPSVAHGHSAFPQPGPTARLVAQGQAAPGCFSPTSSGKA